MTTIKDNRKKEHKFEDLSVGEYFMYEGVLYVVTVDAVETDNICGDDYYESDIMNVLELKSGFLYHINKQTVVDPVDVEITIS